MWCPPRQNTLRLPLVGRGVFLLEGLGDGAALHLGAALAIGLALALDVDVVGDVLDLQMDGR